MNCPIYADSVAIFEAARAASDIYLTHEKSDFTYRRTVEQFSRLTGELAAGVRYIDEGRTAIVAVRGASLIGNWVFTNFQAHFTQFNIIDGFGRLAARVGECIVRHQCVVQPAAGRLRRDAKIATASDDKIVDDHLARAYRRHDRFKRFVPYLDAGARAVSWGRTLAPEALVVGAVNQVTLHEGIGRRIEIEVGVLVIIDNIVFQSGADGESIRH